MYYVLDGKTPVVEPSLQRYAKWYETADRIVKKTKVSDKIEVSTVFLGIDHSHGNSNRPILFETLVFGGKMDGEMLRYSTWEDAEYGHQNMVEEVREKLGSEK